MTITQTITIRTSPEKVYEALMSADQFSEVTGAAAGISSEAGGAFSCFGGLIVGRHIELLPNERIVQAWRVDMWPEGVYSVVRLNISESGGTTTLELVHTGYPEGAAEHLEPGWHKKYWDPLKTYLE